MAVRCFVKLEWSLYALSDREEIFDYIEADSPRAAVAVDELIASQVGLLIEYPEAGRMGRIEGTRELAIRNTPYIVACRVIDGKVRLLRVLHGARAWPEDMPH